MKIVIVDDNISIRKVLASLFESQGHEIVANLGDGAQLLECVRQKSPHLVCLDYNLPGQNGLELLVALQSEAPDLDVVLITGSNDPDLTGKAANAGAAGFMHKPFLQDQILNELKQIEEARKIHNKSSLRPVTPSLCTSDSTKNTAVIIDDSGSVRMLLKGILESMDITVLDMAMNGEDGVASVKKHHPALVCLDVEMPRMTGLEALPLIRQASPQSKVVMVTGHPNKDFVEASIAGGAKGYLLKPVRPIQVEEFIRKLIAQ